jgi:RimJ/RimL family protein N-acetyltransferase
MQIETERLILRDHEQADWEDIHEYASLKDFSKYDAWGPNNEQQTKDFVQLNIELSQESPRQKFNFAIVYKENMKVIGGIGIRLEAENSLICDIGYAIHPDYQKKGLTSEATLRMFEFAKQNGVKILWATCHSENIGSYKVMEKCGMKRVGLLKMYKEYKGGVHDFLRYEIEL